MRSGYVFLGLWTIAIWQVSALAQAHHSVIIKEIMADPSPSAGLPAYEWVEIQNISTQPVQMQHWRLADASSVSGPMPAYILQPDSVLILCSNSALHAMNLFGNTLPLSSFPVLDNAAETIVLRAPNAQTVHAVSYETSWYRSSLKEEGGWTLEMINTKDPCSGMENWTASVQAQGGTPGRPNSVNQVAIPTTAPRLLHSYTVDSTRIILVFDRTLDSSLAVLSMHYQMPQSQYAIASIRAEPPLMCRIELQLTSFLKADSILTIEIKNVPSCLANKMPDATTVQVGLASTPVKNEWIINEILFNPRSSGFDFLECLNNSKRILDLSQLYVCSRQSNGALSAAIPLSTTPWLVFPGDYYCFTEDPWSLAREYLVVDDHKIISHSKLPSFPDTEGTITLLDRQGKILDELHYWENWHFPLLNNKEGISLERIRADYFTQHKTNWHSAASTAGFATPGRKNSQQQEPEESTIFYEVVPPVFSPDMDGQDDICTLFYKIEVVGQVATVQVLNIEGRTIRNLVPRATLSFEGHWNWDGLDDKGKAVPPGIYLFNIQQFGLNGIVQHTRIPVIIARSFK